MRWRDVGVVLCQVPRSSRKPEVETSSVNQTSALEERGRLRSPKGLTDFSLVSYMNSRGRTGRSGNVRHGTYSGLA